MLDSNEEKFFDGEQRMPESNTLSGNRETNIYWVSENARHATRKRKNIYQVGPYTVSKRPKTIISKVSQFLAHNTNS